MDAKEQAAFDKLTKEVEQLRAQVAKLEAEVARLKITPRGGGGPGEER